jgi:hypothetical protein
MQTRFLFLLLSLIPSLSWGQYHPTIRSGRPGQSIGPYTTGLGVLQLQAGINYNRIEGANSETDVFLENNILRWGIRERIELSGGVNWRQRETLRNGNETQSRGLSRVQLGGRFNLLRQHGIIPAIGIQGRARLGLPVVNWRDPQLGSTFILATGHSIGDRWGVTTNWGVSWAGTGEQARPFYTTCVSFSLTDRFGTFAEVYGNLDDFTTNFDAGFAYLVGNNFQLDFSAGWQGDSGQRNWFVDGGLSYRLVWRN